MYNDKHTNTQRSTTMLKAKRTVYNAHLFKSRLEARWAVFFDTLGLEWVYEPEGFELGDSIRYLPDFKILGWDTYVEIKPDLPSLTEIKKLLRLAQELQTSSDLYKTQVMLCGTPGMPQMRAKDGKLGVGSGYVALTMSGHGFDTRPYISIACFAMTQGGKNLDIWPIYSDNMDNGVFAPTSVKGPGAYISLSLFHGPMQRLYQGDGVHYDAPNLLTAYGAARSARFEFGQTPKAPKAKAKKSKKS
jgi:hypothetical protein